MRHLLTALLLALYVLPASGQGEEKAAEKAKKDFEQAAGFKVPPKASLKRLAGDLEKIAADLEKVQVRKEMQKGTVNDLSIMLVERVRALQGTGEFAKDLDPVFDRLVAMFEALPKRFYTVNSPRQSLLAVVRQLRHNAAQAKGAPELMEALERDLDFPADIDAALPTDMTLEEFLKKGPIMIFMMKHRTVEPEKWVECVKGRPLCEPLEIHQGKANLGVGVVLRGTVTWAGAAVDMDQTWDVPPLHLELTPEIMALRGLKPPKQGDFIEVEGWTYYDAFHKDEEEHEQGEFGDKRPSVYEIHPVTRIKILRRP